MVVINGLEQPADGMSILEYLSKAGFEPQKIVVELNLEIIPRDLFGEILLKEGDTLEVLSFVGGG